MMRKLGVVGATWLVLASAPASARVTPFGVRVNTSIEAAVQHFRLHDIDRGALQWATGLGMMCMLEKRASADWNAPSLGYQGMDDDDQARMRATAAYMLELDPSLSGNGVAYSYGTGANLMALSLYLATGGPSNVGGNVDLLTAVRNGMHKLRDTQGAQGCNEGGWNYYAPGADGDLSCTQFALAGVSASRSVLGDEAELIDEVLAGVRPMVTNTEHEAVGGYSYRGCRDSATHSMTASGIWSFRLSGLGPSDERVQKGLRWWDTNYAYASVSGSYYYALWAAAKAFAVSRYDGLLPPGEGTYGDDIGGTRSPAEDGYPEEDAEWYYDFAYHLTETQNADGAWGAADQNGFAATAWACLVLEKSLGGVCLDQDEDGVCETEDNCRRTFNPGQVDVDGDNIGDACDNCPGAVNLGQEDIDQDGIGDGCDKLTCIPTHDGIEVCDGRDNDCNGFVDDGEFPAPAGLADLCRTELPGVCAEGSWRCANGEMTCIATDAGVRVEVCDHLDNDCDGRVDEDSRNACGMCGAEPDEICNGVDDDCNGLVDDGVACADGEICIFGECAVRCEAGGVCGDALTCRDAYCVAPCAGVECADGMRCFDGECIDPCANADCDAGEVCVDGRCGGCLDVGCPAGLTCLADGGGVCVPDPCDGVGCGDGEFCLDGICKDSCATVSCALGSSCRNGECVDDACGGVQCEEGQACIAIDEIIPTEDGEIIRAAGACVADPCAGVGCDAGELCHLGRCYSERCGLADCGDRASCETVCIENDGAVSCEATCRPDWLPPPPSRDELPGDDDGPGDVEDVQAAPDVPDPGPGVEEDPGPIGGDPGVAPPEDPDAASEGCACQAVAQPSAWQRFLTGIVRR